MKNYLAVLAGMLAFCCCERISPDGDTSKRSDTLTGTDSTETETAVPDTALYVTGVKYPDDYYWQRDTAYGSVERSIVVYKDGELILELPVGDAYFATGDCDMHRVAGGHLYTDYSTTSETVVCCDGTEAFRYSGREMMRGFIVSNGDVYTLGLNRSGTGVTYRCNGELVYEKENAVTVGAIDSADDPGGALYEDEGEIYFTVYDSSYFYSYGGGTEKKTGKTYRNSKQYVHDFRIAGGTELRAWADNRYPVMSPALSVGYERYYLGDANETHTVDDLRLVYSGSVYYVKGTYTDSETGLTEDRMWGKDGSYVGPGTGYDVYDFCTEGTHYAYAAAQDGELALLDNNGSIYTPDGRWRLTTRKCLTLFDGSLYAALTAIDAYVYPALWIDGEMTEFPFNGYLSSVIIEVN